MEKNEKQKVKEAVITMLKLMQLIRLYDKGHVVIMNSLDIFYGLICEVLQAKECIMIGVVGNEMVYEKEPFYEITNQMSEMIKRLKVIGVEKIMISRGVKKDELLEFCRLLGVGLKSSEKKKDFEKVIEKAELAHISVGKIYVQDADQAAVELSDNELSRMADMSYQDGVDFFTRIYNAKDDPDSINAALAYKLVGKIMGILSRNKNLLVFLTSTKVKDRCTFVHDLNVSILTLLQAEALNMDRHLLNDIGTAALLHDIGKILIPEDILNKNGKLTEKETSIVRRHPVDGAKLLLDTPGTSILSALVSFEHHMLYDRSGYPNRLKGRKVNMISMMVTIADVYDAMRSNRPYRQAKTPEMVYDEMMSLSGGYFHPDLLVNFFKIIGLYPAGTWVELNTGEIAMVSKANMIDIRRPEVNLLYNNKGVKYDTPRTFNLLDKDEDGKYKFEIVKSVPFKPAV